MTQQEDYNISVDEIPIDIEATKTRVVEPETIPTEISLITQRLASGHPPTNPLVILQAARWWYIHGQGENDPVFRWALDWALSCTMRNTNDTDSYRRFCEYLISLGVIEG